MNKSEVESKVKNLDPYDLLELGDWLGLDTGKSGPYNPSEDDDGEEADELMDKLCQDIIKLLSKSDKLAKASDSMTKAAWSGSVGEWQNTYSKGDTEITIDLIDLDGKNWEIGVQSSGDKDLMFSFKDTGKASELKPKLINMGRLYLPNQTPLKTLKLKLYGRKCDD